MKQNIMGKLNRLFSGITDSIKVTYYTSKSKDIMKFEMLEHEIAEENGTIRIVDVSDNRFFTPKTVIIDLANVDSVTYECFFLRIPTVRKVCGGNQPATAGF